MVAVGLQSYIGCAKETTWGTAVTPSRFYEFLSESLDREQKILQSNAIRAGARNLRRGARRAQTSRSGKGGVKLEVATTAFGLLFEQILGGTPAITNLSGAAYQHVYSMGSLANKGSTWQKVLRDSAANVVSTFTFPGCKVASAEFSNSVDNFLNLDLDLITADVLTATAPATLAYPASSKLFNFEMGVIKFNGTPVGSISDWSTKIDNKLKDGRYFIGSGGVQAEPVDGAEFPEVTGKLAIEFVDQATAYDVYAADTGVSLDIVYTGATIVSTYRELFQLSVPEIHLLGEVPKVGGGDLIALDVPYEGASTGSAAGCSITYVTTDSAA